MSTAATLLDSITIGARSLSLWWKRRGVEGSVLISGIRGDMAVIIVIFQQSPPRTISTRHFTCSSPPSGFHTWQHGTIIIVIIISV